MKTVEGWNKTNLDSVISAIQSGSRPKGGVTNDRGDIPSLGGENIINPGGITLGDVKLVSLDFYHKMTKGHLQDGDVLINKDGAQTGKVGFYKSSTNQLACINEHLFILRGIPNRIEQKYLYYTLLSQSGQHQIRSQISGSAQPGLKSGFIKGFMLDLPALLSEQAKIAEILSTVDRAIEQTEALIAKQQRIKTGLMQDLLTRGIDGHGNLRSEQTHQFKDSPLGRIPVEWALKRIGDVFEIQLGKMLSQKATEGRFPFFYLGNKSVQWDRVDTSELQLMDFNERERRKFELKLNDILVCEGGEVGRTAIWREEVESCYYQKAVHRLRPIDLQFLPGLFPRFMKWCIRKGLLSDYTSQTSIAHLTQEKLAAVPIMVPTLPEQIKLNAAFDQLDNKLDNQSANLSKLRSLKTGLMQDLLTGKKRVLPLLDAEGLKS